jgi:hypothetical protein
MPAGCPRPARFWPLSLLAALLPLAGGCGNLPRQQLAQCQNRSQLLQAEASRLRDDATQLRSKNRELAQRAVEDARRLRGLEEANRRLEKSVIAYQDERDQVQNAFNELKRELIAAADSDTRRAANTPDALEVGDPEPIRTALANAPEPEPKPRRADPESIIVDDSPPRADLVLPDALASFLQSQTRTRLEEGGRSWTIPASLLFEPGSDRLSPRGAFLLASFTRLAESSGVRPRAVIASPDVEPIQRTSAEENPESLPDRRALAVRNQLASLLQLDREALPARVGAETDASGRDPAPELTISLDLPR